MTDKKKILMLSDHPLSTSGVGTQARWLIQGLLETGKYSFRCFGGAVKHENYDVVTVTPDFIIKPTDGFGDKNMIRKVIAQERPDALLLFTDPRFFMFVFEMAEEIHSICPITYNHLWDNVPVPEFNKVIYEECDLVNCINYPTYEFVSNWFPNKTNYIPHAVPKELFKPLPVSETQKFKTQILGPNRDDHFIVTFVSRNAKRKMPSDVIYSFKMFLEELQQKFGHKKATLVMHTDPLDPEGPNLHYVNDCLGTKDNVVFSKERINFNEMNILYNISDTIVNISSAEGFGLGILEAKMAGVPVIAIKTGGLTRQVQDWQTQEHFGVALDVECRSLIGTQGVPYIWEDFVTHKSVANAYMKMYEMGAEKRKELGLKAMQHAHRDYDMKNLISEWDRTLTNTIQNWRSNHKRWSKVEL
jgi:glycosyltransferase involved in cell wall biosynthesis